MVHSCLHDLPSVNGGWGGGDWRAILQRPTSFNPSPCFACIHSNVKYVLKCGPWSGLICFYLLVCSKFEFQSTLRHLWRAELDEDPSVIWLFFTSLLTTPLLVPPVYTTVSSSFSPAFSFLDFFSSLSCSCRSVSLSLCDL